MVVLDAVLVGFGVFYVLAGLLMGQVARRDILLDRAIERISMKPTAAVEARTRNKLVALGVLILAGGTALIWRAAPAVALFLLGSGIQVIGTLRKSQLASKPFALWLYLTVSTLVVGAWLAQRLTPIAELTATDAAFLIGLPLAFAIWTVFDLYRLGRSL